MESPRCRALWTLGGEGRLHVEESTHETFVDRAQIWIRVRETNREAARRRVFHAPVPRNQTGEVREVHVQRLREADCVAPGLGVIRDRLRDTLPRNVHDIRKSEQGCERQSVPAIPPPMVQRILGDE